MLDKILTISTGHIKKDTANHIHDYDLMVYDKIFKGELYGYYIYVYPCKLPEDLKAVVDYATKQGCSIVCLDVDGPICDHLPFYSW